MCCLYQDSSSSINESMSTQKIQWHEANTLYFFLSCMMSGKCTMDPSMLNTPSTTMRIFFHGLRVRGCPYTTASRSSFSRDTMPVVQNNYFIVNKMIISLIILCVTYACYSWPFNTLNKSNPIKPSNPLSYWSRPPITIPVITGSNEICPVGNTEVINEKVQPLISEEVRYWNKDKTVSQAFYFEALKCLQQCFHLKNLWPGKWILHHKKFIFPQRTCG